MSITTDKTSYRVGDAITICITVSEAGRARLIDKTAAGESEISNGPVPAGMTCTSGTIAPPAGTECVRLEFFAPAGAVVSAEACFQVMGAATPAASAPPAAAATPCTWTGTWRSQAEPDLVLTQSGAQVTGTFGFRGRVQGTVAGDMLTGSVTNAQGQVTQLSFRMSASIDVFTGQFRPTSTPCQVMAGTVGTLPRDFTRR